MVAVHCAFDEMMPIESVIPNPRNPNTHPDKQIKLLAKIINTQGWQAPITVSKRSGFIVRGHGRLLAAQLLNLETVPVDLQDYESEAAEWADLIADNRLAELATIDDSLLAELLKEADDMVELTGYTANEIDRILGEAESSVVQDDNFDVEGAVDSATKNTITQPGDLWILGNHRLLCGDSTSVEDVLRLLGGDEADMVFTDPPYNVAYEGGTGLTIMNDSMADDEFYQFLLAAFKAMYAGMKPGAPIYVCHADGSGNAFRNAFGDAGLLLKQVLIWVKNSFVLGRQDYQWMHEPILYGWKPGTSHKWYGGRKQGTVIDDLLPVEVEKSGDDYLLHLKTDTQHIVIKTDRFEVLYNEGTALDTIWRVNKPLRNGEHPTMKPIELCARGIQNSSREGDIVLEPFGGSGSTLIASEQTGRRCCAMELDPVYCDVIVKRYSELVGSSHAIRVIRGNTEIYLAELLEN